MRLPSTPLTFALALELAACAPPEAPAEAPATGLVLAGVRHDAFRDGRLALSARIDALALDRASGRVEATGVTLADGASREATLSARRAEGSTRSPDAALSGGVLLTGPNGERLVTDACSLDLAHDAATGRAPVALATPDLSAGADGFSAQLGGAPRLRLEGRVRASSAVKAASTKAKPTRRGR